MHTQVQKEIWGASSPILLEMWADASLLPIGRRRLHSETSDDELTAVIIVIVILVTCMCFWPIVVGVCCYFCRPKPGSFFYYFVHHAFVDMAHDGLLEQVTGVDYVVVVVLTCMWIVFGLPSVIVIVCGCPTLRSAGGLFTLVFLVDFLLWISWG